MNEPGRIPRLVLFCLLTTASALPALDYGFGPGNETMIARREIHRGILNQTARTPDRYRWLAAGVTEVATRALTPWMPYERAFDRASFAFYFAAIAGMLWSLFAYLRRWFGDEPALIAALVASCTLRIVMRQHDYAPYSFLEPTFVSLALLAILDRRWTWLGALIAVATFNRETAIFLVLLYVVTSDFSMRAWQRTASYAGVWAICYGIVRIVGGDADRYWTLERVWRTNMSQPQLALMNATLLLGVFWLLAVLGWRHASTFVRRTALVIPAYLVTIGLWGIWWEVRLLLPLYPVVFALALSYLYRSLPGEGTLPGDRDSKPWHAWVLAGIFATVVATNAFDYSVLVPRADVRLAMHQAIVDGTAPSPQRFRVLVPWSLDPIVKGLGRSGDEGQSFRRVYSAFHFVALTALIAGVYAYSRLWFSRDRSLIGALVIGTVLHLVLRMGEYWDFSPIPTRTWFAPWSLLEPVFVAAGLVLLAKRRVVLVAIVTVVAALNSEASIVLPLAALWVLGDERRTGFLLLAAWAVVTMVLRLGIGGFVVPPLTLAGNLAHWQSVIINLALFLGPAWLIAIAGFRGAPASAQRAVLALVPVLLAIAIYGDWWDVRLLTPAYPIIAPMLLAGLQPAFRTHRPHR